MSATDCLIAGMAILLHLQQGGDRVVLATADERLSDVIRKAKTLTAEEEGMLGLEFPASHIGLEDGWSREVYPECVNLIRAQDSELRRVFLGWPLPEAPLAHRTASELMPSERDELARIWVHVKREYQLGGEDSLPYTLALDDLRTRFACASGYYVANDQIYRALQNLRKAGKLPPDADENRVSRRDEATLFDEA